MSLTPLTLFTITPWMIVMLVILVVLIGAIIFLTIWGKKQQKKMDDAQEQIKANSQNITMLVIDKKRMKLTESGVPKMVIDATPKMMRRSKVPVVKAKVGPKIMTLLSDEKVFDMIPVKQEIKATVSGIYITNVRSLRGPALVAPEKLNFRQRLQQKLMKMSKK